MSDLAYTLTVLSQIARLHNITIADAKLLMEKSTSFMKSLAEQYPLDNIENINKTTEKMKEYQSKLVSNMIRNYKTNFIGRNKDGSLYFKTKNDISSNTNSDEAHVKVKHLRMEAIKVVIDDYEAIVTDRDGYEFEVTGDGYEFEVKVGNDKRSYLVYTDDELETEGIERMKENIHHYTSEYLRGVFAVDLPICVIEAIKGSNETDANKACKVLIDDWGYAFFAATEENGYSPVFNLYDNNCTDPVEVENDLYIGSFYVLRTE